jgi:hypothetical protein
MNVFGEAERLFSTVIFPYRLPLLAGLAVGLVVLVAVGLRRGWWGRLAAAARRHPARALVAAVVVAAVIGPTAWYVASPLVIRTELVEAAPLPGVPRPSPGPSTGSSAGPTAPSAAPSPVGSPDAAPVTVLAGTFVGADDFHQGSGSASVLEVAPGRYVLRLSSFSVTNGPDLHVLVSPDPDGYAAGSLDLGKLKATDGAFNYELPVGFDPAAAASVVIWCDPFEVQFAHATLVAG